MYKSRIELILDDPTVFATLGEHLEYPDDYDGRISPDELTRRFVAKKASVVAAIMTACERYPFGLDV